MKSLENLRIWGVRLHKVLSSIPEGKVGKIWDVVSATALSISALAFNTLVANPWLDLNYIQSRDLSDAVSGAINVVIVAIVVVLIIILRGEKVLPKSYYFSLMSLLAIPATFLLSYFYWISQPKVTFWQYFKDSYATSTE